MLAMRVMEAENMVEGDLFDFLINGPKNVDASSELPHDLKSANLPWMNRLMWADLH